MIEKLAEDITNKTLRKRFYILFFGITALISIITTASTTFLTEKISSYVVKSEFEASLKRIEVTVEKTEKIQQKINSIFSNELESKKIKRKKYEELYLLSIQYSDSMELMRRSVISSLIAKKSIYIEKDFIFEKMLMLQSLYFSDIEKEMSNAHKNHLEYSIYLAHLSLQEKSIKELESLKPELIEINYKIRTGLESFRSALIEKYSRELNL